LSFRGHSAIDTLCSCEVVDDDAAPSEVGVLLAAVVLVLPPPNKPVNENPPVDVVDVDVG
jgi:hypothetical protein